MIDDAIISRPPSFLLETKFANALYMVHFEYVWIFDLDWHGLMSKCEKAKGRDSESKKDGG